MKPQLPPLIQASQLKDLYKSGGIVIVDVRNVPDARSEYRKKHLKGAVFADLNSQLSEIQEDPANGGRHPLPSVQRFAEMLADLGISGESHVIVYDEMNCSNTAARLWWMLKAAGHKKVQVLDGGLRHAEETGLITSSGEETNPKAKLRQLTEWNLPLVKMNEVEKASNDTVNHVIIDIRETTRYEGITEPIDLVAGHIPGAVNVPFSGNLDDNGLFLHPEILRKKYESIFGGRPAKDIIVHCGSGVTACHTLLAIASAGMDIPALYVGSWSEWSRNDMPVAGKTN